MDRPTTFPYMRNRRRNARHPQRQMRSRRTLSTHGRKRNRPSPRRARRTRQSRRRRRQQRTTTNTTRYTHRTIRSNRRRMRKTRMIRNTTPRNRRHLIKNRRIRSKLLRHRRRDTNTRNMRRARTRHSPRTVLRSFRITYTVILTRRNHHHRTRTNSKRSIRTISFRVNHGTYRNNNAMTISTKLRRRIQRKSSRILSTNKGTSTSSTKNRPLVKPSNKGLRLMINIRLRRGTRTRRAKSRLASINNSNYTHRTRLRPNSRCRIRSSINSKDTNRMSSQTTKITHHIRSTNYRIMSSTRRRATRMRLRMDRNITRSFFKNIRPSRRTTTSNSTTRHRSRTRSSHSNRQNISNSTHFLFVFYTRVLTRSSTYTSNRTLARASRRMSKQTTKASYNRDITTRGITSSSKINNIMGLLRRITRSRQRQRRRSTFPSTTLNRRRNLFLLQLYQYNRDISSPGGHKGFVNVSRWAWRCVILYQVSDEAGGGTLELSASYLRVIRGWLGRAPFLSNAVGTRSKERRQSPPSPTFSFPWVPYERSLYTTPRQIPHPWGGAIPRLYRTVTATTSELPAAS